MKLTDIKKAIIDLCDKYYPNRYKKGDYIYVQVELTANDIIEMSSGVILDPVDGVMFDHVFEYHTKIYNNVEDILREIESEMKYETIEVKKQTDIEL